MRIEYDPDRDLLYIWFGVVGTKAARTLTVTPGVYADFDAHGKLVGLEVLDATEVLGMEPNHKSGRSGVGGGRIWALLDT